MKENKFVVVLIGAIVLLFAWELYYIIDYIRITNSVLPTQVSIMFLTWKQSYDEFLAVPNFFLIPLVILLSYLGAKRLKQK